MTEENTKAVAVTQADREAAAKALGMGTWADATDYRNTGLQDRQAEAMALAFARHRLASLTTQHDNTDLIAGLRARAVELEEVNASLNGRGSWPKETRWASGKTADELTEAADALQAMTASPRDSELIDWIEERARNSRTGISFDWVPSCEGEPSGFRFMRRFFIGEPRKTLRDAIQAAMAEVEFREKHEARTGVATPTGAA